MTFIWWFILPNNEKNVNFAAVLCFRTQDRLDFINIMSNFINYKQTTILFYGN